MSPGRKSWQESAGGSAAHVAESTARSLVEQRAFEWGLAVQGVKGPGLQAGVAMLSGDKETLQERHNIDGFEGAISRSLVHLFSFIKLISREHTTHGVPEMWALISYISQDLKKKKGNSCPSLSYCGAFLPGFGPPGSPNR